jgi:transposase
MDTIIAFDSHKHYTLASVETKDGRMIKEQRINHRLGSIKEFLADFPPGSPVAVETIGSWYWITDEIEQAGMKPELVHARKAKLMLGSVNKTDKLDARGLNKLQRAGTLPTVWIPPAELRDGRELPRTRMVFAVQRTRLKNRIHSVLAKYGLQGKFEEVSDIFGGKGRKVTNRCLCLLPLQTRWTMQLLLEQLDIVEQRIKAIEDRMADAFEDSEDIRLLKTLPGVGPILSVVISQEIGDIRRFENCERLASYSGVTPSVHSSGDKTRYGPLRNDTNHYLKWAFSEAGNSVAVNRGCYPHRYVVGLYNRVRVKRGHSVAVGAVSRHLAESTYWVLSKKESYRERGVGCVLPKGA